MHHLFSLVLNVKDLSKAGDLFSLPDTLIQNDISEIVEKIKEITTSGFYIHNENDQSVVEICIARVTAALRDTDCIEYHIEAIVDLLKTCLNHDLKPIGKDVDPPHAKIASDVLACVFLNYTKRNVMKKSLPTAVKFLHKGNPELTRNVSSYLPLAAIEHPDLLAEHVFSIIDSIIGGNYGLTRILPQIYSLSPNRINEHIMALANLLNSCDEFEKSSLLNLFKLIAANDSSAATQLLEPSLTQLLECLKSQTTIVPTLEVLYEMSNASRLIHDHLSSIQVSVTTGCGSLIPNASTVAAELYTRIGLNYKEKASTSLSYMIQLLQSNSTEQAVQVQILREIVTLTGSNPRLLNSEIIETINKSLGPVMLSNNSVSKLLMQQLWDILHRRHNNVTIVNINQSQNNNSQSALSNAESQSIELLKSAIANSSSHSSLNISGVGGTTDLSSKIFPSDTRISSGFNRNMHPSQNSNPKLNVFTSTPVKNQLLLHRGINSSPIPHHFSHTYQQHKPTITRINIPLSAVGTRKRTAGLYSNQNRSYSSVTGLKDENGNPHVHNSSSILTSQSSIATNGYGGNVTTNPGSSHYTPLSENWGVGSNVPLYSVPHPSIANHFPGNSGTLSSSASILSNGTHTTNHNGNGSRLFSTSHFVHSGSNNQNGNGINSSNKALPNPSHRINHPQYNSRVMVSPSHMSQPDLRPNNQYNSSHFLNNNIMINSTTIPEETKEESNRISVFEPYPMRDTVQHFCEKHLDKIKSYMEKIVVRIPLPVRCTIEERKSKKNVKLHFACQCQTENCIYSNSRLFTLKTHFPRVWIHLMFLALQSRSANALSTREASVSSLKNCWDILKSENKSFLTVVTSAFPSGKDQDGLLLELQNVGFFDLFEFNALKSIWGCFFCNHPKRAMEILSSEEPILEGCLKEKKGKWKAFKRWRTKYFTLSGGQLQGRGNDSSASTLNLHQILSLRVTRGHRNIPKAFEIFTEDKSVVLKPKNGKNANEWVQCLSVLVAKKETNSSDTSICNNVSLGKGLSISGLRSAV